jgi:hypothetical protein
MEKEKLCFIQVRRFLNCSKCSRVFQFAKTAEFLLTVLNLFASHICRTAFVDKLANTYEKDSCSIHILDQMHMVKHMSYMIEVFCHRTYI